VKVRNGNDSSISASCARGLVALSLMATLVAGGVAAAPVPAFAATNAKQAAADKAARAKRYAKAKKQAAADKAARAKRYAKAKGKAKAKGRTAMRGAVVGGWYKCTVSWYGPGFYGHGMAGGGVLKSNSVVVAHRTLRFGTRVQFAYGGKTVIAVVRDRGPFIAGRYFDLGPGTAAAIGFQSVGVGVVQYRILH
jgi:rare lipoprotein A (peptidoglycan hydrolase)